MTSVTTLFTTDRLIVRPWTLTPDDIQWAHRLYSDPEVVENIGGQVMADLDATRAHMQMRIDRQASWDGQYGLWALESRDDGRVVGSGIMKPLRRTEDDYTDDIEIGWHLARAEWGKGYATEMARGLIKVARAREIECIHAVVEPENTRSVAVAVRLGFEHRGTTTAYYNGITLAHYTLNPQRYAEA